MFFVLFFLVSLQVAASTDSMSNQISSLKALAARTCYERQIGCKEFPEVQELIDLYKPLTIHNALDRLIKIKTLTKALRINDPKFQKQCIGFIRDHRVEICFESKDPETNKLFSDFDAGDRVESYHNGIKRLEAIVNIYDRPEANIKLSNNYDVKLTEYVFTRRDLPVCYLSLGASAVITVFVVSFTIWTETLKYYYQ